MSVRGKNEWLRRQAEMDAASSRANAAEIEKASCAVCEMDNRAEIDAAMRSGQPLGIIIERFGIPNKDLPENMVGARHHRDHHLQIGTRVAAPDPKPQIFVPCAYLRARHAEVVAQIDALTQRKKSLEKFIALAEKGLEEAEKETRTE